MLNSLENCHFAELICFYTKKGDETPSPYQAQVWKMNSIPVYVRLKSMHGNTFDSLLHSIHFKYRRKPIISTKSKGSSEKYELLNVICDTRVLCYDEVAFFQDDSFTEIGVNEAWNHVIATPDDIDCEKVVSSAKANGQNISLLYVEEPHYSNKVTGIIPNIQNYDQKTRTVTTKTQKIFLQCKS